MFNMPTFIKVAGLSLVYVFKSTLSSLSYAHSLHTDVYNLQPCQTMLSVLLIGWEGYMNI